jgi:hypothetical protein
MKMYCLCDLLLACEEGIRSMELEIPTEQFLAVLLPITSCLPTSFITINEALMLLRTFFRLNFWHTCTECTLHSVRCIYRRSVEDYTHTMLEAEKFGTCGNAFDLLTEDVRFKSLARTSTILTESFRGFIRPLQADAGIAP